MAKQRFTERSEEQTERRKESEAEATATSRSADQKTVDAASAGARDRTELDRSPRTETSKVEHPERVAAVDAVPIADRSADATRVLEQAGRTAPESELSEAVAGARGPVDARSTVGDRYLDAAYDELEEKEAKEAAETATPPAASTDDSAGRPAAEVHAGSGGYPIGTNADGELVVPEPSEDAAARQTESSPSWFGELWDSVKEGLAASATGTAEGTTRGDALAQAMDEIEANSGPGTPAAGEPPAAAGTGTDGEGDGTPPGPAGPGGATGTGSDDADDDDEPGLFDSIVDYFTSDDDEDSSGDGSGSGSGGSGSDGQQGQQDDTSSGDDDDEDGEQDAGTDADGSGDDANGDDAGADTPSEEDTTGQTDPDDPFIRLTEEQQRQHTEDQEAEKDWNITPVDDTEGDGTDVRAVEFEDGSPDPVDPRSTVDGTTRGLNPEVDLDFVMAEQTAPRIIPVDDTGDGDDLPVDPDGGGPEPSGDPVAHDPLTAVDHSGVDHDVVASTLEPVDHGADLGKELDVRDGLSADDGDLAIVD